MILPGQINIYPSTLLIKHTSMQTVHIANLLKCSYYYVTGKDNNRNPKNKVWKGSYIFDLESTSIGFCITLATNYKINQTSIPDCIKMY